MTKLPTSLSRFFWHFIKRQPIAFLVFFLMPISIVLETNVIPYALKMLIDTIIDHQGNRNAIIKAMAPALWMGVLAWSTLIILMRLQHWWEAYVIPRFEADIRMSVLNYVMSHSYHYFINNFAGSIANKINDLPKAIESIRMILCWNIVSTSAVIFVGLIMMASINTLYSFILGLWVVIHIMITLYCIKFVNKSSKENAEDKSTLSGNIVDTISNINSVKLFSGWSYELDYIGKKQLKERTSNSRLIITMNIFHLVMDISVTTMLGVIFYSLINDWEQEKISPGNFVFIFNMIFAVMNQIWHIGHVLSDLFREIGTAQQALMLIACPHQIIDNINAKPIKVTKGEIIFNNVIFHYDKRTNIFENKNVKINGGQKVGLVGFSGSGKSTFVNLILRFFDIKSGAITIDGQNIKNVTQDSLRKNIAMIPQDVNLFHRTLIENIRYGLNATDEDVILASKKAYCHDFITLLPDNYNSMVGERGINLSCGQRQRISIAKAILKNAPILILDEATSALDSITEKHIQESLHQLMQNRTTIVIAHRLSTLSEMDRILVFDKGHIIEDGTHAELIRAKGHYSIMWEMQVNGFLPDKFGIAK